MIPQSIIDKATEIAENRLIVYFSNVGNEAVDEAVSSGDYTDRSGNLRSSIGFVVSRHGKVANDGGFWHIKNGSEGQNIGRAKAVRIASETEGIALILVAGMDYAQVVADKGYNVLDSAERLAHKLVSQLKSK